MPSLLLLGRILFGGYFLFSGLNHFMGLQNLVGYASSRGVPSPQLVVIATGAMLVLGGLSVLLGMMPRIGLFLIIAFLVPTALVMHNFWALEDPQVKMMEMSNFLRNLALTGAALGLLAVPVPWPFSLDKRTGRRAGRQSDWLTGRSIPH